MSYLKTFYVCAPPQLLRTGKIYPGTYEVGDRIMVAVNFAATASSVPLDCWVCTTPGTYDGGGVGAGSASTTYQSGTAIFTRTPSIDWSTALPNVYWDGFYYLKTGSDAGKFPFGIIDADYGANFATSSFFFGDVVFVDRVTMIPRVGVWPGNDRNSTEDDLVRGRQYYGDVFGDNSFHGGSRLHRRKTLQTSQSIINRTRVQIPSSRMTNATYLTGTAARVKIPGVTAVTPYASAGTGITVEMPDVPSNASFTYNSSGIAFTKYPQATPAPTPTRTLTVPITAVGVRDLYNANRGFGGNTAKPDPDRNVRGQNCLLQWVTHTYRNGAAPANTEVGSLEWVGVPNANASAWTSGYIYLYNSLTGARTLKLQLFTNSPYVGDITNKDVWMEVFYNNSATGGYVLLTTENVNWGIPGASATVIPAGAETWTSALTYTQTLELSLSLTIGRAGMIAIRLINRTNKLGQYRTFVDPFATVT